MVQGGVANLLSWMLGGNRWIYADTVPTSERNVATTAICAEALAVALARVDLGANEAATRTAITNSTSFLTSYYLGAGVAPDCSNPSQWAFYPLQYFVRLRDLGLIAELGLNQSQIDSAAQKIIQMLQACLRDSLHKGIPHTPPAYCQWECCNCSTCNPAVQTCPPASACNQVTFKTAPALVSLFLAKESAYAVDCALIQRGLDALQGGRIPGEIGIGPYNLPGPHPGAFTYLDRNLVWPNSFECQRATIPGAVGRTAIAETALYLWRATASPIRLENAVDVFFGHLVPAVPMFVNFKALDASHRTSSFSSATNDRRRSPHS
jgi:hypothetical protein